jgi:hypothetical protein
METKICGNCDIEKPVKKFCSYKIKSGLTKYARYCNACSGKESRKRVASGVARKRRKSDKIRLISQCIHCNENNALYPTRFCRDCRNAKEREKYHKARKIKYSRAWFLCRIRFTKARARRTGRDFNLTFDEFQKIFDNRDKPCPYCKRDIVIPSVDRIDNNKGYIRGNCILVCKNCNSMKKQKNISQFNTDLLQKREISLSVLISLLIIKNGLFAG